LTKGDFSAGFQPDNIEVRFGSLADMEIVITDVCFASKSGHVRNQNECPLCAISGHTRQTHNRCPSNPASTLSLREKHPCAERTLFHGDY